MEGATIGAYRVLRKLGEGGMGAVYLAEHTLLGRRAAIKVLLPSLSANDEIVHRFFNEARAVTQIADPGIVQVFDFGQLPGSSAFIVMELLEGEPLDRRLERLGRFALIDCLRLVKMICRSLAAAHGKGIVHRDLKPENLFIVGDPAVTGGERPKILDFGIAKLSSTDAGKLKTRTGMLMGTPVYMSPEQCRGAGDIDHRSDVYSIGCVMFCMLAGRPPFDGEASGDLIVAHLREPPPLVASFVPGTPELVDQILQRCLAKSPADRFATMLELVAAIDAVELALYRSGASTIALDPGALARLTPLPRPVTPTTLSAANGQTTPPPRRRSPAIVLGTAAGVLAIAAGITLYIARRDGAAPPAPAAAPIEAPAPRAPPAPLEPVATRALDAGADAPGDAAPDAAADAAISAPLPKPKHHGSSSPRPTDHAQTPNPDEPPVIDRGD